MKTTIASVLVSLPSGEAKVRFTPNLKREIVVCKSKGQPAILVSEQNGRFFGRVKGSDVSVSAKTPSKAFARSVKAFW